MTDYEPIDCGLYSAYEVAILQRKRLRISWRDAAGQPHIDVVAPKDLRTLHHEEFLVVENQAGLTLELRLDFITNAESI